MQAKAPKLTQDEVESYHKNGYLLYKKPVFSDDKLARLTSIFEEHLANKGDKLSDELDTPHWRDERLLDFLLSREVLDLAEPLIGPNIGLFSSHFICKDPYNGRRTPWHTDEAYWKKVIDRHDKIVTVWLAIDRSTGENGCLGVLPGSHRHKGLEYDDVGGFLNLEVRNMDKSNAVYFELERGECSLHDARIVHGADANTSPYRRCGYTMRYFATDSKLATVAPESGKEAKIVSADAKFWLARGVDLGNNNLLRHEVKE